MIAEHEIEELATMVDKIVVLYDGRLISVDNSRNVLSELEKLKAIGVDPPSITELFYMFQKELGIKFDGLPITLSEGLRVLQEMMFYE